MSYDLNLFFEPPVPRRRILQYFAARERYKFERNDVVYQNPDTGVYFFMTLQCKRDLFLQKSVVSAAFEINYSRPSFFGTETEIELSNLVATFRPRIEDGQMYGMGEGPYSGAGFLRGWTFGNVFGARVSLADNPRLHTALMPADKLRAAWAWNYHLAEHRQRNPDCFVPTIRFFHIEGRACVAVPWGDGMPFLLPKVDYVLVGRDVSGELRFGLAPWSEVVEVVARAGFETASDPIKLTYLATPRAIADWVVNIPLIDDDAIEQLSAYQILDEELITAAGESIESDKYLPNK